MYYHSQKKRKKLFCPSMAPAFIYCNKIIIMEFLFNDGGRSEAGFQGTTGDCVCRAIAIATCLPYRQVYDRLAKGNASQRVTKRTSKSTARKKTARNGIYTKRKWCQDYLKELGFVWVPTKQLGQGFTTHLRKGELPDGILIVKLRKHLTTVIDG